MGRRSGSRALTASEAVWASAMLVRVVRRGGPDLTSKAGSKTHETHKAGGVRDGTLI